MAGKTRCPWVGWLVAGLVVAGAGRTAAQTPPIPIPSITPAEVAGTVVDSQGAAIPGAQVTVTDPVTGRALTTTSDDRGFFKFSTVVPGDLVLTAEVAGFSVLRESLAVRPGSATAVTMHFAEGGPVPVTGPSPAPAPAVHDLSLDEPGMSERLRSEAARHWRLSAIVAVAERRSLFVFEQSADAAIAYEMVPTKRPLLPDDLQALLADRTGMTFLGVHWLSPDSCIAVFRHDR